MLPTQTLPSFQIFRKKWLVALLFLGSAATVFSQVNPNPDDPRERQEHTEFLEKYFQEYDFAGESDIHALVETLRNRLENPLDLNRATREQLRELLIFSDLQIENLLAHRARLGKLATIYELQSIENWKVEDIRRALPFIKIGEKTAAEKLKKNWQQGKTELLLRANSSIEIPGQAQAEGSPLGMGFRLLHRAGDQFSIGLLGEKDVGEAFFRGSNAQGFDFYSAHVFAKNLLPRVKTLAVGDFSARFGQSLLLNSGFSIGKTAESIKIVRSGEVLSPYASFGESRFFRGAAATFLAAKNLELTTFFSDRRRDANLVPVDLPDDLPPDFDFSAFQNTGLHRTPSEIADEKSVRERAVGGSLRQKFRRGEISANLLKIDFDRALLPADALFRKFEFSGKNYLGGSVDYRFSRRNLLFFGETAISKNGKPASLNGFLAALDRRLSLALLHRFFSVGYQNLYGTPFAETRAGQNEQGVYFGLEARPTRQWQVNFFADVWKNLWLRYQVSAPATGQEFLGRVQFSIPKKMTALVRFQSEKKWRNSKTEPAPRLDFHKKHRLRGEVDFQLNRDLTSKTRCEWSFYQIENQGVSRGFLAFQEFSYRRLGLPVSATARFAVFDTDDTEARIFAVERDLFAAISVPGWSGRGTRFYLNLTWKISPRLSLESRWASNFRLKTVADTQKLGRENEWKLQFRWRI